MTKNDAFGRRFCWGGLQAHSAHAQLDSLFGNLMQAGEHDGRASATFANCDPTRRTFVVSAFAVRPNQSWPRPSRRRRRYLPEPLAPLMATKSPTKMFR